MMGFLYSLLPKNTRTFIHSSTNHSLGLERDQSSSFLSPAASKLPAKVRASQWDYGRIGRKV